MAKKNGKKECRKWQVFRGKPAVYISEMFESSRSDTAIASLRGAISCGRKAVYHMHEHISCSRWLYILARLQPCFGAGSHAFGFRNL